MKYILNIWFFLFFLIVAMLVVSSFIVVPTSLTAEGILVNKNAIDFTSSRDGILKKITKNKTYVNKNDLIFVYENLANYEEINEIDNILNDFPIFNEDEIIQLFELLSNKNYKNLGEIQLLYIDFLNQLKKFTLVYRSNLRAFDLKVLSKKINSYEQVQDNDSNILKENVNKLIFSKKMYLNDSLLFDQNLITIDELNITKSTYLQAKNNLENLKKQNVIDVSQNSILELEMKKTIESQHVNLSLEHNVLVQRYIDLKKNISEWKSYNLIFSPIDGYMKYYRYWKDNDFIYKGDKLFVMQDGDLNDEIEVNIKADGLGKMAISGMCLIELQEYPASEYGFLEGKIIDIIDLKHKDKDKSYTTFLKIKLINGNLTTQNINIDLNYSMPVNAEIITENGTLFNKIFKRISNGFKTY